MTHDPSTRNHLFDVQRLAPAMALILLPGCILHLATDMDLETAIERTSYWLIPGFVYIYYKSRSLTAFHWFLVFLLPFGRWHSSGIVVFCWFWPLSIALFHRFNRRLDRSMKGAE